MLLKTLLLLMSVQTVAGKGVPAHIAALAHSSQQVSWHSILAELIQVTCYPDNRIRVQIHYNDAFSKLNSKSVVFLSTQATHSLQLANSSTTFHGSTRALGFWDSGPIDVEGGVVEFELHLLIPYAAQKWLSALPVAQALVLPHRNESFPLSCSFAQRDQPRLLSKTITTKQSPNTTLRPHDFIGQFDTIVLSVKSNKHDIELHPLDCKITDWSTAMDIAEVAKNGCLYAATADVHTSTGRRSSRTTIVANLGNVNLAGASSIDMTCTFFWCSTAKHAMTSGIYSCPRPEICYSRDLQVYSESASLYTDVFNQTTTIPISTGPIRVKYVTTIRSTAPSPTLHPLTSKCTSCPVTTPRPRYVVSIFSAALIFVISFLLGVMAGGCVWWIHWRVKRRKSEALKSPSPFRRKVYESTTNVTELELHLQQNGQNGHPASGQTQLDECYCSVLDESSSPTDEC